VRSACDSERPTTVTHGQSWSLGGCKHESAQAAFALVRALETSPQLVVRGRVELPTFRFKAGRRRLLGRAGRGPLAGRRSYVGDEDQGVTVPGFMWGREPRWELRGRTAFQFSGLT
jgi:hypothetical protein